MQTTRDALEQFLIRLKGHGEDLFLIAAGAADEAIAGYQGTEWTGIHVGARHILRAPDLARDIAGFFDPRLDGVHTGELAIEKKEALRQVVIEVLALIVVAREITEPDAGLRPVAAETVAVGLCAVMAKVTSSRLAVMVWFTMTPSLTVQRSFIVFLSALSEMSSVVWPMVVSCQSAVVEFVRQ